MDTLQLARKEAEAWKLAQVGEAMEEPETIGPAQKTENRVIQTRPIACQVDTSWSDTTDWTGLGVCANKDRQDKTDWSEMFCKSDKFTSSRGRGLLWAMTEVSRRRYQHGSFKSDCQQLVNIIGRKEDWPALAPEIDEISTSKQLFWVLISFSFLD